MMCVIRVAAMGLLILVGRDERHGHSLECVLTMLAGV